MQPNMKKEYRAELKVLRKNARSCRRDFLAYVAAKRKEARRIDREITTSERRCNTAMKRLQLRIAILEGRLSS